MREEKRLARKLVALAKVAAHKVNADDIDDLARACDAVSLLIENRVNHRWHWIDDHSQRNSMNQPLQVELRARRDLVRGLFSLEK